MEINHEILADDSVSSIETRVLISVLIKSLAKLQQNVINMKFIQGFSEKYISKVLGISRQAVNRTKNRALNNLRKLFLGEEVM